MVVLVWGLVLLGRMRLVGFERVYFASRVE
jgi:hypothetical protein